MKQISKAKKLLNDKNLTCVIIHNDTVLVESTDRGILPLVKFVISHGDIDLQYPVLADKIIGKAAALVAVYVGIKELHTNIISTAAKKVLDSYEIKYAYDLEVPFVENRDKTGLCPMEGLSKNTNDPKEMYTLSKKWLIDRNLL